MEDIKSFKRFVAFVITFALFSQTAFASIFTVNNTTDASDISPGTGTCDIGGGNCTLRAAIQEANALGGITTINIGSGIRTITASNGRYPTITNASTTINGAAASSSSGDIVVDGNGTGATTDKFFHITANTVSITDLVLYNTNAAGFVVTGASGVSLTRVTSGISAPLGSAGGVTLQKGFFLETATNATLRSVTAASADGSGIYVHGSTGTTIVNSRVGTHYGGTATRANAYNGIEISGNTAGTNVISNSVVSGNTKSGILFSSTGTLGGTWWLWGNKVGVDSTGNRGPGDSGYTDMGNTLVGVHVKNSSNSLDLTLGNNRDSTGGSVEGNTISDNGSDGVNVRYAQNLVISGNTIGTDQAGLDHIPNAIDGIFANAVTLDIGTDNDGDATDAEERNVISGNAGWGIEVNGAETSTINIRGNMIGANWTGTSSDGDGTSTDDSMTNASGGILVSASGASTINIGAPVASGSNAPARNIIINNGGGIKFTELGSSPATVKIQNNYIGVQSNGSVTAGNTYAGGFNDGIDFNLTTGWANLWIGLDTVSITKSNIIAANQKGIDIGNGVNTLFINGNYIGAILNAASAYIKDGGNLAQGIYISASNSDLNMVTIGSSTSSNLGNVVGANNSGGLFVGNAGDSGTPSQLYINNNRFGVGGNTTTALTNTGAGIRIRGNVATITMTGNIITNSTGTGVDIRSGTALTFTGNVIGASGIGTTAASNGSYGLYIDASTLASVVIGGATAALSNIFAGNVNDGISIANLAADNTSVTIKGNYIGVCANPTTGSISSTNLSQCKNSGDGIQAARGTLAIGGDNSIGAAGTGAIASGNVIAGNASGGISISNNAVSTAGVRVATIVGNLIGVIRTTASGVFATANGNVTSMGAITVNSYTINTLTIGDVGVTTASSKRNIISGTTGTGGDAIYVAAMSATGTGYIKNNYIGTDWTGATALANKLSGISVGSGTFQIGGTGTSTGNLISGNRSRGVYISGSAVDGTNTIRGNTIGLNAAGHMDKGNTLNGIAVQKVAAGAIVQIGGTQTAARNYISGNDQNGIYDVASNAHTLNVYNNYIGLNAAGTAAIANANGVVFSSTAVTANVGDSTGSASARNVIAGNTLFGILVHAANSLIIKGNYIGLAADGTTLLANGTNEIYVDEPSSVTTLTIGGSGNKINNTSHIGVSLRSVTATNEETMDSDNTWTDTVVSAGDYKFWKRYLADGTTLVNWGPKDCYDGVDNDGDNLIDYSQDTGCSNIRDDSEDPGSSAASAAASAAANGSSSSDNDADDVEDNDEDVGEEEEEDEDAADEGEDEEDIEPEPEPPLPPTPPQPEQPQTPAPPQPPADPEDAREKLLDAASVVVDTVSGARQAEARIENIRTIVEEEEEEDEIIVEKTEEQKLLESTLGQAMAGEVTEEEIKKFEAVAGDLFEESVNEYLDKLESKGGEFAVTIGGKKRVINKNTKVKIELGSQKDASANQEAFDEAGENKLVIGPSTILTGGVAEILKLQEGAPFDVEKPADKVFVLGLPGLSHPGKTIEDFLPEKAAVTSPADGQEVSTEFLVWAVSPKKDDVLSFFLVDRVDPNDNTTWKMYDLGEVTADGYKVAAVMDLTDHNLVFSEKKEFDLVILNEEGEGSSVKIVVNPELQFEASEVRLSRGEVIELGQPDEREDISDILHTSVLLASAKVVEENTDANIVRQEPVRKLTGYITPGATVFITWKSVVMNSVVVADASQGYFEIDMPEELARGDHEVLVYAYNKKKNWTSSVRTLLFNR